MDSNKKQAYVSEFKELLASNILGFWTQTMKDPNGGFYGQMTGDGVLHRDAERGVILNARILWTYSAAYNTTQEPTALEQADHAYAYLMKHFVDEEAGGIVWSVDASGAPVETKKQIYAQAFTIYALSEYYMASGQDYALEVAQRLFALVEQHSFDVQRNGYLEALDRYWQPLDDVRLSEKDLNATKTMNTHLHVLEAYTNLYRVWKDERLAQQLANLIDLMKGRFLSDAGHFHLFFDDDWQLQSDEISFGHDIEGAWLLHEAAEVLGDAVLLEEVKAVSLLMTDAALLGLDADGGLMNEANTHGLTDTDKHWWPQAEALVGLYNAFELSGEQKYLVDFERVWQFVCKTLIREEGEWYWRVNRDGEVIPTEDLAGPWKCPYHNGRAMLELIRRMEN
ncbi:AGE family epimerase/isomerase [Marinoscillum furvescens]|uniref:Cellobiose 2-epimerase n=1 Tax=Marinoscillum furvescens DSM 4134 TaxID=1122208 RepID=A0A3D9L1C1_MARFU|nr:AGE family epimerase/isomerase [Marinoscillum furvescens]RED95287.1 mannobiose 2-epimerase [Marinoscillum furvescens DSM 4134]